MLGMSDNVGQKAPAGYPANRHSLRRFVEGYRPLCGYPLPNAPWIGRARLPVQLDALAHQSRLPERDTVAILSMPEGLMTPLP